MRSKSFSRGITALLANLVLLAAATLAAAQHEAVLYRFQGLSDGAQPQSTVIAHQGFLYGTAKDAGDLTCNFSGCGTVFQMIPPASSGNPWTQNVLYTFLGGNDGAAPWGSLIVDKSGNLYGTTYIGGGGTGCQAGCGTVVQLSPGTGGLWNETALYRCH